MSFWDAAWIAWLGMFLLLELPAALDKKPGNTFSEHVWRWFCARPERKAILGAFLAALSAHLLVPYSTVIPVIFGGIGLVASIVLYYVNHEEPPKGPPGTFPKLRS